MKERRLVSMVLNWNRKDDMIRAVDSLSRCSMPGGWHHTVLVVDNGSTDGSVAAIQQARSAELLVHPTNLGFAKGNNTGLRWALENGADAVLLLNNDATVDGECCAQLISALEGDPKAGAAGPLICEEPRRDRIWYAGGKTHVGWGITLHRGWRSLDRGQYVEVEETGHIPACGLLAWSRVWREVGLLDEQFVMYAEDADWCLRVQEAGYRLLFVPSARVWHKVSASSEGASERKIYQRLRSHLDLYARHARGLQKVTWLPSLISLYAVYAGWLGVRGRWAAIRGIATGFWDGGVKWFTRPAKT